MGEAAVRQAFAEQAVICQRLGSNFVSQLCQLVSSNLSGDTRAGRHLLGWKGEPGPAGDLLPLRLAGALHALVLLKEDRSLARVFPPRQAEPDGAALWRAIENALEVHCDFILDWVESAPQTNEVRRSAAVFCGMLAVAKRYDLPIELLELGASAGLNLIADRYAYTLAGLEAGNADSELLLAPQWHGGMPPLQARVTVAARAGCDLNPLDPGNKDDLLRLKAYTWPDQRDRLARLEKAAACASKVLPSGAVEKMDATAFLQRSLEKPRPGRVQLVFHTIAWQYFPAAVKARCQSIIETAGARANADAPLAWLAMEADGQSDAALDLRLWPGGDKLGLARVDFHGRVIKWLLPPQG